MTGMAFGMVVVLPTRPGRANDVVALIESEIARVRSEDGNVAFSVHLGDEPDQVWLYEAWVDQAYHDDVHEAYPEVKNVLARIPDLLRAAPTFLRGDIVLQR